MRHRRKWGADIHAPLPAGSRSDRWKGIHTTTILHHGWKLRLIAFVALTAFVAMTAIVAMIALVALIALVAYQNTNPATSTSSTITGAGIHFVNSNAAVMAITSRLSQVKPLLIISTTAAATINPPATAVTP